MSKIIELRVLDNNPFSYWPDHHRLAASPPRARTWRPVEDVVANLLPTIARRAIAYRQARGDIAEAEAIRQTAQRVGVLPS